MTTEEAHVNILHWLLSPYWTHKRPEIIRKVKPDLLEEPYKTIFVSHVDFYKDKRPMGAFDFNIAAKALADEKIYLPFCLDEAIKVLAKNKLEKVIAAEFTDVLSKKENTSPAEFLKNIEGIVRDIYSKDEEREKTAIRDVLDEVATLEGSGEWGLNTGYTDLDTKTGGLRRGTFWVIGGYANVGKTGFVVRMTDYLCYHGRFVVFYSLEMNRDAVGKKLIDYITNCRRIKNAYDIAADYKLHIANQKRTVEQIERHLYALPEKPDVIIIDYLHLLGVEGVRRDVEEYKRITMISGALKNLAQTSGIPVVALSQVSNESAKRNGMEIMGFKGSGSIAADCDVGIELRREYDKEGSYELVPIEILLRKNRYGEAPHKLDAQFNKKTGFIL